MFPVSMSCAGDRGSPTSQRLLLCLAFTSAAVNCEISLHPSVLPARVDYVTLSRVAVGLRFQLGEGVMYPVAAPLLAIFCFSGRVRACVVGGLSLRASCRVVCASKPGNPATSGMSLGNRCSGVRPLGFVPGPRRVDPGTSAFARLVSPSQSSSWDRRGSCLYCGDE
jgi:hypothetical protein